MTRDARFRPRRRDLLLGAAAGAISLLRPRVFRGTARAAERRPAPPPRYWILVVPAGGIDPVWTTDPRTAGEVRAGVDIPYPAREIEQAGAVRLGPHLRHLAPRAQELSIVNGILCKSANHYTGIEQITRLRTGTTMRTPGVFDIIGAHRDSQAVGHFTLNAILRQALSADFLGTSAAEMFGGGSNTLARLEAFEPDELAALARALERQLGPWRGRRAISDADAHIIDSLDQARRLIARLTEVPRFAATDWLSQPLRGDTPHDEFSVDVQRALWLIENDLAATVTVVLGKFTWDTHYANTARQSAANPRLAATLARLLDELAVRSNRHGKLADTTALLVGSEIGRFPYLNQMIGKDHFPQIPVIAAGPMFSRGVFGATGRELEALPVSASKGRQVAGGERLVLDDVGYTALRIAGIKPESYAVAGRELGFLRAPGGQRST